MPEEAGRFFGAVIGLLDSSGAGEAAGSRWSRGRSAADMPGNGDAESGRGGERLCWDIIDTTKRTLTL